MDGPNVNLMTETQKRLYKKIQERKLQEEKEKAVAAEQEAASQQAKKKKKNRKKKKSGPKAASNSTETGESSPSPSTQLSQNSENSDPSQQGQTLSTAAKKRRRRAAKKAAAAAQNSEANATNDSATEESIPASVSADATTDEKQTVADDPKSNSEKTADAAEKPKLEIDRSTFSEVQERLKQLEDQALGRRPMPKVKGAENAPDWLGKEGNEKVLAGSAANAKHHVVTGDDDDMSDLDKAKMQALLGNAKAANTKSYVGLKDVTQTLTADDYDNKMTVVFQSCKGCHFTLDALCTKVFITACKDFTITIDKKIVTQTMELFRCSNVTANLNVKVRTVQADMSDKITLKFDTKENFDNIIWAGCEELVTEFGDVPDRLATGWTEVQNEFADLNKERSQFKIHYVGGKLSQDKVIRMSDGFPTTKLAYDEYMRKQEAAIQSMAQNMGITINKKQKPKEERAGRNDPCPCGTGKKYKKCCGK